MDQAAQLLRNSDDTVAAIARSVGYGSEYAFSRAFTRSRGIPAGRYRTHSRPSDGSELATPADPTRYTGSVSSTPHPATALSARAGSEHAVSRAFQGQHRLSVDSAVIGAAGVLDLEAQLGQHPHHEQFERHRLKRFDSVPSSWRAAASWRSMAASTRTCPESARPS